MSSKQTRRSVSISGDAYAQLKEHCTREEVSMSGLVEKLIREVMGMAPREMSRKTEQPRGQTKIVAMIDEAQDFDLPKVEVVRTVATAPVHPTAKPANGKHVGHCPAPERTYGLTEAQLEERKAKIISADERRAGNIFTF